MPRPRKLPPRDVAQSQDEDSIVRWATDNIGKDVAEVELWRRWMRWMCREDLYFLCREVLGMDRLGMFHVKQCGRLNTWPTMEDGRPFPVMADFWPRGWFKTTIATEGRAIQTLVRCPEESILVEHGVDDLAEEIVGNIRMRLEHPFIRWLFPDIIPKPGETLWTKSSFNVKRKGVYRASSVQSGSPEAAKTGGHYTLIIADDLVFEGNIGTRESMDKVYDHFVNLFFQHDNRNIRKDDPTWWPWFGEHRMVPFRVAVVSTRWDINDANSRIIDPASARWRGKVNVNIQPAEVDGDSQFPEEWPMSRLMDYKESIVGPFKYSAQMMQDPYPSEEQFFRPDCLQVWTERTLPSNLYYFTSVDMNNPPEDDKSEGDYGVVMTVGVSDLDNIYVMKIDRKRFMPHEQVMTVINHWMLFKPKAIAVEDINYQKVFKLDVQKTVAELRLGHIPLRPLKKTRGDSQKVTRIKGLDMTWSRKAIHYNPTLPNQTEFREEAARWRARRSDRDDMLDTLVDCIHIKYPPGLKYARKKHEEVAVQRETGITGDELLARIGMCATPLHSPRAHGRRLARMRRRAAV